MLQLKCSNVFQGVALPRASSLRRWMSGMFAQSLVATQYCQQGALSSLQRSCTQESGPGFFVLILDDCAAQVQQALHRVNWPRDLASSGSQISCAPRTKSGTLDSVAAAPPGTVSAGNFAVTATTPAAAAVSVTGPDGEVKRWQQQQQHEAFDISAAPESWVRVPARLWHRPGAAAAASFDDNKWDVANPGSSPSSSSSSDDKPDLLPSIRASCAGGCGSSSSSRPHSFCISSSDPSASSFICKNNVLGLGTAAIPPAAAAADGTVYGSGSSSKLRQMISLRLRRSSRFWSIIGSNPAAAAVSHGSSSNLIQGVQANHVRGLRVRMGVASGCVPGDTDIARCALFELAKGKRLVGC